MDIKKTSTKDIYKCIQQDYSGLYTKLQKVLGDSNPFAKFNIGAGMYIWSSLEGSWHQMIAASDIKQIFVREALTQLRRDIASKVGEKTAEVLLTVPDESYIYFNDDSGEVRILITGWGFKKPVNATGEKDVEDLTMKNPVSLSFSFDGEKLPNYQFGLRLAKQVKILKTDGTGYYNFDNLNVGENFVLHDIESGVDHNLTILPGKSEYDFDVTRYVPVNITARFDGQPMPGESLRVDYNGHAYEAVTDGNGNAVVSVPFHSGQSLGVDLRGQVRSEEILPEGNNILFDFEKQEDTDVTAKVFDNGAVAPAKNVHISYAGQDYDVTTDANGDARLRVVFRPGQLCEVSVVGHDIQRKPLMEGTNNMFVFNKMLEAEKRKVTPHIKVEGDDGYIGATYPITVEHNGVTKQYISDDNGIVRLPEMTEGDTMKVVDGLNPANFMDYTIDPDTEEYIFDIANPPEAGVPQITVMAHDIHGENIFCDHLLFQQEGAPDFEGRMNEEGKVFIPEGKFALKKTIHTTIVGGNRPFPVIDFLLEKDEYVYLLQEDGQEYPWWKILLEIFGVIAVIMWMVAYWWALSFACVSIGNLLDLLLLRI